MEFPDLSFETYLKQYTLKWGLWYSLQDYVNKRWYAGLTREEVRKDWLMTIGIVLNGASMMALGIDIYLKEKKKREEDIGWKDMEQKLNK